MNVELRTAKLTAWAVFEEIRGQEITFLAASIAYYAFVALLPMLVLAVVVATAVGGESLADQVVAVAQDVLTPTGQQLVKNALTNAVGRQEVTVVGTLVLVWSTLKLFRGLDKAFSQVYDVTGRSSLVEQFVDALVVLGVITLGVGVMVATSFLLARLPRFPYVSTVSGVVLLVVLVVLFLPLYYVFPDVEMTVQEAVPGAVVAAVGWTVLQVVFQVYVEHASQYDIYGVLGAVLLLVTWFYFGGIVILVGAVVNVVMAGRSGRGVEE